LAGIVVGVAIATALVPPLASCGLLLARHLPTLAAGALVLFLANFAAIVVGATLVFIIRGHRPSTRRDVHKVVLPRSITLVSCSFSALT